MEGKQDPFSARGGETLTQSHMGFTAWVPLWSGVELGEKGFPHHQADVQHYSRGCFSLEDRPQGS